MKTSIANAMELAAEKTTLDEHVVNLFKHKAILAILLQLCVSEFKGLSAQYIMENCFIGEPIVKKVPVDQNVPLDADTEELFSTLRENEVIYDPLDDDLLSGDEKIIGQDTVDKTQQEGTVIYDVIFLARAPKTKGVIQLILNIEIQTNNKKLRYQVATRGIYYGARMISAQKNRIFTKTEYQKIQKVYSIWICPQTSGGKNSITSYDIQERSLYGRAGIPQQDYDKLNVTVITLNEEGLKSKNSLIQFLSLLTSDKLPVDQREQELQNKYYLQMTKDIRKDVSEMCNYSDYVYERGQIAQQKKDKKILMQKDRKLKAAEEKIKAADEKAKAADEKAKAADEKVKAADEKVKAADEKVKAAEAERDSVKKLFADRDADRVRNMAVNGLSHQTIAEIMGMELSDVMQCLQHDSFAVRNPFNSPNSL